MDDPKSLSILMIDDDEEDFALVEEALASRGLKVDLYWAADGDEAIDFVLKRGQYSNAPTPNLILLDLNMPGKNGFEVLRDLKADEELRRIPVAILPSSRDQPEKCLSRIHHRREFIHVEALDLR